MLWCACCSCLSVCLSVCLQEFYAMLGADSSRAFYGPGHVLAAAELGAIQTLLISGMHEQRCMPLQ